MDKEKGRFAVIGNIVLVLVLIAIITVAIWGAINAVRLAPRLFTSVKNTIVPSAPIGIELPETQVGSGEPFSLSWTDKKRDEGLYTIVFACTSGIDIDGVEIAGTRPGNIPCGTAYAVPASVTSIRLAAHIKNDSEKAIVPVTISYLERDGKKISEGIKSFTVVRTAPAPQTTKPGVTTTPKPTYRPAPSAPKPAGPPDLVITKIALGVVDPMTGAFIQKNTFGGYEIVSIRFDVANRGSGRTGNWSFVGSLPTRNGPLPYQSPVQRALNPGDHIEFKLDFGTPVTGPIQINVDSVNAVPESNEYNNALTDYVSVIY